MAELDAKLRDPKLTGVDRMYVYDEYANLQRQPYLAAHPIQAFFMPNGGFDNALGVAAAAVAVASATAPCAAHVAEHCGGDGPIPRHDGKRIPDSATTQGRGKVVWQTSADFEDYI